MVLSGNTLVSDFSISSSFHIGKSIGRGHSSQSSQAFELPSPPYPSSTTLLVFVPLLGYSYTLFPSLHLFSWHLTAPFSTVDRRSLYQNPTSVTPVLLAVANAALAHPLATPHQSHLYPPFNPTIGHRIVPRDHSAIQVHTFISSLSVIDVTFQG